MATTQKSIIRKPKCLFDLQTAGYIKIIGENNRAYTCRSIGDWGEVGIYEDGTLIGFVHNDYSKGYFKICRSIHGIQFEALIKYNSVQLYGTKLRHE